MDETIVFGWAVGAIAAYAVLTAVLARLAQPLRLEMAERGCKLLERPDLREKDRTIIKKMLDEAFDWAVMAEVCALFPVILLRFIRTQKRGFSGDMSPPWGQDGVSEETGQLARQFTQQHLLSVAAANPLCSMLLVLEVFVAAVLVLAVTRSFKAIYGIFKTVIAKSDHIAVSLLRVA